MARKRKSILTLPFRLVHSLWHFVFACLIPFGLVLSGLGVLIYQVCLWLSNEQWTSVPSSMLLNHVLPTRALNWLLLESHPEIQKIGRGLLSAPLASFLLCAGVLYFFVVYSFTALTRRIVHRKTEADSEQPRRHTLTEALSRRV